MTVTAHSIRGTICLAVLLIPAVCIAGEKATKQKATAETKTVEMFEAIRAGDISVQIIPKDSTQANVLIKNKTSQPLTVKAPESFVAMPVLGQRAGGGGSSSRSGSSNSSSNQSSGGGMMGGSGGGMGMFNVPPEKVIQTKVTTVCLEHGKKEPHAAVPYEIKPVEAFTEDPAVNELCKMVGEGKIDQRSAQAAAWHLTDKMSWETLTAKRLKYADGSSEPYFSAKEIQSAMSIAQVAIHRGEEAAKVKKPETEKSDASRHEPNRSKAAE